MADTKTIDSKKVLKDLADNKVKMKYNDRLKVEIIKATKHYKKGAVVNPHKTWGEALIKEGIAKKVTK